MFEQILIDAKEALFECLVVTLVALITISIIHIPFYRIKKMNYKRYDHAGKEKILTELGHCYYLFYTPWTVKGFRIPFTLRKTKIQSRIGTKSGNIKRKNKKRV